MYPAKELKILVFSDCMSFGCWVPKDKKVFYPAVLEGLLRDSGVEARVENIAGSGETTGDSLRRMEKEVLERDFDLLVYQCGVNDALPRGLTREERGSIIRLMYRSGMNEKARFYARTYFLNPLEFLLLKARGPKFYATGGDTAANVSQVIKKVRDRRKKEIPILIVSVNPVLNYRFGNSTPYIIDCNKVLGNTAAIHNNVFYIDTCSLFLQDDLPSLLDLDLFHLSEKGHLIVAGAIRDAIAGCLEIPSGKN